MPASCGLGFVITARVDANYSVDTVTQRSKKGFIVYVTSPPVYWMSKKQTICESSSFGSESIATKQCREYIRWI